MTTPIHTNLGAFFAALAILATGMAEDSKLSEAEIADAIDELVDTGTFDDYDDPFILGLVEAVAPMAGQATDALRGLLDRDPAKIRERADAAASAGKTAKAARMRARADRIEARQGAGI